MSITIQIDACLRHEPWAVRFFTSCSPEATITLTDIVDALTMVGAQSASCECVGDCMEIAVRVVM